MLDQLLRQGILKSSGNDGLKLASNLRAIPSAKAAYFDLLNKCATSWIATGWAVDAKTKEPALFVFPLLGESIPLNAEFRRMLRPDVNAHLDVDSDKITGFSVSFSPGTDGEPISLVAVMPSGDLARLPPPHRESAEPAQYSVPLDLVSPDDPEWQRHWASPIYRFPQDASFHGLYSFQATFSSRHAGVTEQFLEDAAVYHRKYSDYSRWTFLLSQALSRAGITTPDERPLSVLDVGSGSGNTVIPLLNLLPNSRIVATDISPQLLAILRDELSDADRARVRLIAMDAAEHRFAPGTFDLVVGLAILHHIMDPSQTIGACHRALKSGANAIFFEPFEEGYVLLRLLYEQLLEHRAELGIADKVAQVLRAIIVDVDVRTGSDKSGDIYQSIDDKWLFTRTYLQGQQKRAGFSELNVDPLDISTSRFSDLLKLHLRLCLGAEEDAVNSKTWDFVRKFELKFSDEIYSELLFEACVTLKK